MAVGPVLASAGGKGKYRRRVRIAILLTFSIIIKSNLTILRARYYYEKPNLLVGKLSQKSQRAVLSAEANQEVDHAHIGDSHIWAPRNDRFFRSG